MKLFYILAGLVAACQVLAQSNSTVNATAVQIAFIGDTCDDTRKAIIRTEFQNAYDMAVAAQQGLTNGDYYGQFFAQSLRNDANFAQNTRAIYGRIAQMLSGTNSDYTILVTCDFTTKGCRSPQDGGKDWVAHNNAETFIMNFCPKFFDDTGENRDAIVVRTQERIDNCNNLNVRQAHRSRAPIILHECSHTAFAIGGPGPTSTEVGDDFAYGYTDCSYLARGQFNPACRSYTSIAKRNALCQDANGSPTTCQPELSRLNADTYALVAAGIWFTGKCGGRAPTLPALDPPPTRLIRRNKRTGRELLVPPESLDRRANQCHYADDYLIIDGDDENSPVAVTGLVAFGDSFAAGMGTGTTTGDKCRVGSSNYGDLVYNLLGDNSIPHERLVCSGDTLTGLAGQIDKWQNQGGTANVGLLTIGGNDLNFKDLVWNCVITPNTARFGWTNRANCIATENAARDYMNDQSQNGLRAKLRDAYLRILQKSGRTDFQLYVTSYPSFFNEDTTDCDQSTFHYWWAAYRPPSDWPTNRIVYLTQSLRRELDDLVRQLNGVILQAVLDADAAQGGNQIHYVDVYSGFEGHHWCEQGVHEPDSSQTNTYFFLSGWSDVSVQSLNSTGLNSTSSFNNGVNVNTDAAEAAELRNITAQGTIKLPDPTHCLQDLGDSPDPYDYALCRVSETIRDDPNGPEAQRFARAQLALTRGNPGRNVTIQDVEWYLPTRQIKTFHPRTPGMIVFRDKVIEALQANGQLQTD